MKRSKFNWIINYAIRSPELRVIGPDGKQIGVLKKEDAIKKAQGLGLDLVEIAPTAKPPVARIAELGKLRYEQEKKQRREKKNAKSSELKEVRFSPFIADHDFNNRIGRIEEFLKEKNKVRIVVVFMGRHMGSKQFGYQLIKRIADKFEGRITLDAEPKFIGRHLFTIISPLNKVKVERQELKENTSTI